MIYTNAWIADISNVWPMGPKRLTRCQIIYTDVGVTMASEERQSTNLTVQHHRIFDMFTVKLLGEPPGGPGWGVRGHSSSRDWIKTLLGKPSEGKHVWNVSHTFQTKTCLTCLGSRSKHRRCRQKRKATPKRSKHTQTFNKRLKMFEMFAARRQKFNKYLKR